MKPYVAALLLSCSCVLAVTACGGRSRDARESQPFSIEASTHCFEQRRDEVNPLPGWGIRVHFRSLGGNEVTVLFHATADDARRALKDIGENASYKRARNVLYPADRSRRILRALVSCLRPAETQLRDDEWAASLGTL